MTKEEDIVYCLLGDFCSSMPTAYGERKESAWREFQTEVEAADSTQSIICFFENEHLVN
jgi:hypothetical protein